jgi:hypothetical protein
MLQRGDIAAVLVQYLEDRNGQALVRLPNGSKTSLPHECLDHVVSVDDLPGPVTRDDLTGGPLLASFRRNAPADGMSGKASSGPC